MTKEDVGWDIPGWDWEPGDNAWLRSGVYENGTSIFFIHGGKIRHQAHLPYGDYKPDEFASLIAERAKGLEDPIVRWEEDTGGGDPGLWVEGVRPPNKEDLARLQSARDRQRRRDRLEIARLRRQYPDNFTGAS
jgi:hypothetical protein